MILKIQNNKEPGIDGITRFWYKSLHSYHKEIELLVNKAINRLFDISDWLNRALKSLLPKNDDTENPKNYQPITCQKKK